MRRFAVLRWNVRRLVHRSPVLFWGLTIVAALVAARVSAVVASPATTAGSNVVVSRHALATGRVIQAVDVTLLRAPTALVPFGAAARLDAVVGRAVRVPVGANSVLRTTQLAAPGQRGAAALVPSGWRVVGLPFNEATPAVRIGQHVDLVTVFDVGAGAAGATASVVAEGAVVVQVSDRRVGVAVPAAVVPRIAEGLVAGHVVMALAP